MHYQFGTLVLFNAGAFTCWTLFLLAQLYRKYVFCSVSDQGSIEVSNADGSSRSVLVHSKVEEPRAVAVHPIKR